MRLGSIDDWLWLFGVTSICAVLACGARQAASTKALDVRITNLPERTQVTCWLPDVPVAPQLRELDFDDADVMSRVMIHRSDYAEMVQFAMESQAWMEEVQKCMHQMMGQEP